MEVILDTGFIMNCLRKRLDFLTQLEDSGFKIQVPREVLQELKDIRFESIASRLDRDLIASALEMLNKKKVKHTTMGQIRKDHWLLKKAAEGYYIATTNSLIKNRIPYRIEIVESSHKLTLKPIKNQHLIS